MDKLVILSGDKKVEIPIDTEDWRGLDWALIKGADCGFDFCGDILEALVEARVNFREYMRG